MAQKTQVAAYFPQFECFGIPPGVSRIVQAAYGCTVDRCCSGAPGVGASAWLRRCACAITWGLGWRPGGDGRTLVRRISAARAARCGCGRHLAGGCDSVRPGGATARAPAAPGTTPITTALVQAYQNNPQLNAQRAATRAVDENVAIALGGYRPRVTATGSLSETYLETLARTGPTSVCTSAELRQCRRGELRGHRDANAVQRFPDRQPNPAGRGAGVLSARDSCARPSRPCCSAPRPPT